MNSDLIARLAFRPKLGLRNTHVNTILSGNGPRVAHVRLKALSLLDSSQSFLLECQDGVRLQGEYSANPNAKRGLVVLIHGWLGSSESVYILSAASYLYEQGFSVFRLTLRDHGDSAGLNQQPFLAIRLNEVLDAVEQIQQRFPHELNFLAGYSLGGNIAVRLAAKAHRREISLNRVVAVCPPIDPKAASIMISASPFYNWHFVKAWRQAFEEKVAKYPQYSKDRDVFNGRSVVALHEAYVPRFSSYSNADEYFEAYTLDEKTIPDLAIATNIVLAADDPVIPWQSVAVLANHKNLRVSMTDYGGHCGFLQGYRMNCWLDQYLNDVFVE